MNKYMFLILMILNLFVGYKYSLSPLKENVIVDITLQKMENVV